MKKLLLAYSLFYSIASFSQNVGVGEVAQTVAKLQVKTSHNLSKANADDIFSVTISPL